MPTYHGLSNIQTNRVVFFRLPIYSFLHRYATALSDISQTATICNKYHLRYAYRNFSIWGGISGRHRYVLSMWYICPYTYCAYLFLSYWYSSVLRKYLKILRIPPEFSAVQCISFFRFGRVSYYAFHTYHTNIGNILLSIEDILYMLPRIAKISHIGGKVVPELGENGLSSMSGICGLSWRPLISTPLSTIIYGKNMHMSAD